MPLRKRRGSEPARAPVGLSSDQRLERRLERRRADRRRRGHRRLATAAVVVITLSALAVMLLNSGGGKVDQLRHALRPALRPPAAPILLPRGGRTVLPGRLVVAYYGIVGTSNILGQTHNPEADAAGVERIARAYARLDRRVQPAFELVTTIASPDPGPFATYSSPIDTALVRQYLSVAHRHRLLLILDFQPGRGEFLPEVRRYARFLRDPAVGVALDPEWKLTAGQVPDQVIGSSTAAAINAVSSYLAKLVRSHRLPQKLFVVHEFRTTELPDRQRIKFRAGLATVLQMDGLGAPAVKLDSYRQVMTRAAGFYPGFKLFLRRVDDPVLLTPKQVLALHPRPRYISYQ